MRNVITVPYQSYHSGIETLVAVSHPDSAGSINRTIVELKREILNASTASLLTINRTIVELKLGISQEPDLDAVLSIVP